MRQLEDALAGRGPALWLGPAPDDEPRMARDVAMVIATSGSTGVPKRVPLSADMLVAAAPGVARALGGAGQWLTCTPPEHVTGLQTMVRTLVAGHRPVAVPRGRFTPAAFLDGVARLDPGIRHHAALVPTQLVRLLRDDAATAALASLDAVMVGAAPLAAVTREAAREHGIRVVQGYGASEVAGGVLYDGVPVDGCTVATDDGGHLWLGGPMVAGGYLDGDDPAFTTREGVRWFQTADLARCVDGRWELLGRADDVINTGGLKVSPRVVEDALLRHVPGVVEALVVGVPDPEWGQAVATLVTGAVAPRQVAEELRGRVPPHHVPRRVLVVDELPRTGPGKPDRRAARALLSAVA